MYCSRNHMELQNKHGALKCRYVPESNLMFEKNSVLTSISCWTSCFAFWLMKLQIPGFLGKQGSCKLPRVHCTKSCTKRHLWNKTLWLCLLRQHLHASIHWSVVPRGRPRLRVACLVLEELPHNEATTCFLFDKFFAHLTTKSSHCLNWSSFPPEQVSNAGEWDERKAPKNN